MAALVRSALVLLSVCCCCFLIESSLLVFHSGGSDSLVYCSPSFNYWNSHVFVLFKHNTIWCWVFFVNVDLIIQWPIYTHADESRVDRTRALNNNAIGGWKFHEIVTKKESGFLCLRIDTSSNMYSWIRHWVLCFSPLPSLMSQHIYWFLKFTALIPFSIGRRNQGRIQYFPEDSTGSHTNL